MYYDSNIVNYCSTSKFHSFVNKCLKEIKKFFIEKNKLAIIIEKIEISDGKYPENIDNGEVFINCINSDGIPYVLGRRIGFFYMKFNQELTWAHEFGHFLGTDDRYNYAFHYLTTQSKVYSGINVAYIDNNVLNIDNSNFDNEFIENFGWRRNLYSIKGSSFIEKEYFNDKMKEYGYESNQTIEITQSQKNTIMNPLKTENFNGSSRLFLFSTNVIEDYHNLNQFKFSFIGTYINNASIETGVSDYKLPEKSKNATERIGRQYKNCCALFLLLL